MRLPKRQRAVVTFIRSYIRRHGYPPTVRDICAGLGFGSTNAVAQHLDVLERKKAIARDRSKSRGILLLEERRPSPPRPAAPIAVAIPILGRIAAGSPLLAEENIEGQVHVDPAFVPRPEQHFALRVVGDSMIEAGIHDGDLIVVRCQSTAEDGQIVVALIDGEATVKRFYREPGGIRLQPANPAMAPICVFEEDARQPAIQGIVAAVFRKLRQ